MHKLLTASVLIFGIANASAQSIKPVVRLGIRGGVNRALTTVDAASNVGGFYPIYPITAEKSSLYAWQAGAVAEIAWSKFALQPALLFSQKGEKMHSTIGTGDLGYPLAFGEKTVTNRYNWLELPVNFVYTMYEDHGLQLFAGPYVALAIGGHQSGSLSTHIYTPTPGSSYPIIPIDDKLAYGSDTNNRRVDAGINFGLGYRQGPAQVQLSYGLGLRNLHQPNGYQAYDYGHNFNADAAYNRVAQLTGTYFFSL